VTYGIEGVVLICGSDIEMVGLICVSDIWRSVCVYVRMCVFVYLLRL
jgi:hypothetical protein